MYYMLFVQESKQQQKECVYFMLRVRERRDELQLKECVCYMPCVRQRLQLKQCVYFMLCVRESRDELQLRDYEIHDGFNFELDYKGIGDLS